jgi:predicted nucleic acid-binding protein
VSDVVVDASVWISRLVKDDANHQRCLAWFRAQATSGGRLLAPVLVLAEIAGGIARRTGKTTTALHAIRLVQRLPRVRLVVMSATLADLAAKMAATYQLRGADAVYVATAQRLGVSLVTLDNDQRQRGSAIIRTQEP